jgi:adhesin transport system membrane fusion protein
MTNQELKLYKPGTVMWLMTALLAIFLIWAWLFEVDQTVRAMGQLIPSARTQVIQALDGGMVKKILVKEGQSVREGEVLALLEPDRSTATYDEIRGKLAGQDAAMSRLSAEAKLQAPQFSDELKRDWPRLVSAQQALNEQRVSALNAELDTNDKAIALARQEYEMHQRLFKRGDVAEVEVMRAERQLIDAQARRRAIVDKFKSDARAEFAKLSEDSASLRFRLEERKSVLNATTITAPMAGVVKVIKLTTEGGVLRQGEELMQLSPHDEDMVVEVKVNPADVGQLNLGLPALIRLDAFDSSIFGKLTGELTYISPDTLVESGSAGQTSIYYRAHIKVDWKHKSDNDRIKAEMLKPGMTATVDIKTGSRSILTYLLKPVTKAFSGALRER